MVAANTAPEPTPYPDALRGLLADVARNVGALAGLTEPAARRALGLPDRDPDPADLLWQTDW